MVQDPSGHLVYPLAHWSLNEHYELDYLQLPSAHLIGLSIGQIMLVGQFCNEVDEDPSAHLSGVLDGVVS